LGTGGREGEVFAAWCCRWGLGGDEAGDAFMHGCLCSGGYGETHPVRSEGGDGVGAHGQQDILLRGLVLVDTEPAGSFEEEGVEGEVGASRGVEGRL